MEGINHNDEHDTDDDDDTSESGGKKQRRAESLGAFLVEPKSETNKTEKTTSLIDQLLGKKAETDDADDENEAALTELSEEEKLFVEQQIVRDRQTAVDAETAPGLDDEQ